MFSENSVRRSYAGHCSGGFGIIQVRSMICGVGGFAFILLTSLSHRGNVANVILQLHFCLFFCWI